MAVIFKSFLEASRRLDNIELLVLFILIFSLVSKISKALEPVDLFHKCIIPLFIVDRVQLSLINDLSLILLLPTWILPVSPQIFCSFFSDLSE